MDKLYELNYEPNLLEALIKRYPVKWEELESVEGEWNDLLEEIFASGLNE